MKLRTVVIPALVVTAVFAAVVGAARSTVRTHRDAPAVEGADSIRTASLQIDNWFAARWERERIEPAAPADELQVLRRLSLSLHGTVPSLEEIRQFEADAGSDRLLRWTQRMLQDSRFADYFAERFARGFVGVDTAPFLVFRRDRFKDWLAGRLSENTPYDTIVREIIGTQGLWTGTPATNFVTSAVVENDVDENKLAGRSVRIFLGQRIDCAQCHNHPFSHWKQHEFEGLASFYGQTQVSLAGVEDKTSDKEGAIEYAVEDRMTLQPRTIEPGVPFHPEWLPTEGTRRERLAGWIVHPDNRRFERAIVNRMWAYLFGRPWHDPVDDIPDPTLDDDLLDIAGKDFRAHGCDLRRLILVLTSTRAFRMSSIHPTTDSEQFDAVRKEWAVFPMTRERPEQVIGGMLQAASVQTINQKTHLLFRMIRFFREKGFVDEYGDLGENELVEQTATITQALQRMNSQLSREIVQSNPVNATGRIAAMAGTDEKCLEVCYLVALTRRPTDEEKAALLPQLEGKTKDARTNVVEDILWALFNTEEFSWSH
jgi:hypothetical protein